MVIKPLVPECRNRRILAEKTRTFFSWRGDTRIQVEHPITSEMVTGIDLIKEQIRIASGMILSFKQPDIKFTGHSFQCRINAEDPEKLHALPRDITEISGSRRIRRAG